MCIRDSTCTVTDRLVTVQHMINVVSRVDYQVTFCPEGRLLLLKVGYSIVPFNEDYSPYKISILPESNDKRYFLMIFFIVDVYKRQQ